MRTFVLIYSICLSVAESKPTVAAAGVISIKIQESISSSSSCCNNYSVVVASGMRHPVLVEA